jgi:hypothetical protein
MMPLGSDHLTGETAENAITHPGQAHFAIPGAKHRCFECAYWAPIHTQKDPKFAVCLKAAALMRNASPRRVPRNALICRYFKERHGLVAAKE